MEPVTKDSLEKEIRALIAEILEVDEEKIAPEAKFVEELGMDSMMALEVLASAEKKYKIKIPEENLTKVTSLNNVVEIIGKLINKK